jgi:hypothetical protein
MIPAAKITLNGPAGLVKTTTAGLDGTYSFSGLPPGDYTVQASAPELATPQPSRVTLQSSPRTLNLQLKVLTAKQQVTVQANAGPAVSTDPASNATALVLRGDDLEALSDNPEDLQTDLQALAGPSAGPSGGAIFIDGFSGGQLPSKESIREIRINQNPFSPEYDKLGYGRVDIFTKPGTDKFHATIAYNFANDFWNSRNPYASQKAPLLLNESENEASGPLGKRSSFTVDLEYHAVNNGSITNAVTLNPSTLVPTPFNSVLETPQRRLRIGPRVDYQLSSNNTLSVRYTFTHADVHDAGIGSFDLVSRGYRNQNTYNTVQVTDTAILGLSINETRFQYFRWRNQLDANTAGPEIQVLGSFNGGGALVGQSSDTQNSYELQNYTSTLHGSHTWKFGVRLRGQTDASVSPQNFNGVFTFSGGLAPQLDSNNEPVVDAGGQPVLAQISSIEQYRRTLLFQQLGLAPAQIRALGGGASQFSVNAGTPGLSVNQADVGLFLGDDWRARPNLTLSFGLRYETQTNIHDLADFAPRIALAWAPGKARKTVLRGGFGMFYDRFALANTLTAQRYNGVVQQQYVITNPDTFPNVPPPGSLAGAKSPQVIQQTDANFDAPYIMQSALTLERQLPRNTTVAFTYTNSHGLHILRSEDINAPLPGTYNPNQPGSGVFPLGTPGPLFLMTSSGVYNQNQFITNFNSRLNPLMSLFGFYVWNHARSDSDNLNTFPANPYNFAGEYGRAATDIRHRFVLGGSINTRWNVRLSPLIIVQSGPPFDITTGRDLYGTTLFNTRPGIATDPNRPGAIPTSYGLLDPNPSPTERILPRNAGQGPGQFSVNIRLAKTFGFGPERGAAKSAAAPSGPGTGTNTPNVTAPGGMRGLFSQPSSGRRYSLTISMSARNVLNHVNPGPIIGNISSPLFGRSNQIFGTPNGEGFSENASNRRLELQTRFTF